MHLCYNGSVEKYNEGVPGGRSLLRGRKWGGGRFTIQ
nr:MAG TPA: hypothetical protein [Caudoviricetes sp.]